MASPDFSCVQTLSEKIGTQKFIVDYCKFVANEGNLEFDKNS